MTTTHQLVSVTCGVMLAASFGCAMSRTSEAAATIVAPTAQSRAELERTVATALGGVPVTLADDALMRESVLSIERQQLRDASGRRIEGRTTTRPELFRLIKRGERCVLIHERTQAESVLSSTQCTAQ